jgi:hypothetical protein
MGAVAWPCSGVRARAAVLARDRSGVLEGSVAARAMVSTAVTGSIRMRSPTIEGFSDICHSYPPSTRPSSQVSSLRSDDINADSPGWPESCTAALDGRQIVFARVIFRIWPGPAAEVLRITQVGLARKDMRSRSFRSPASGAVIRGCRCQAWSCYQVVVAGMGRGRFGLSCPAIGEVALDVAEVGVVGDNPLQEPIGDARLVRAEASLGCDFVSSTAQPHPLWDGVDCGALSRRGCPVTASLAVRG